MTALIEQILSKKMGVAMVAMLMLSQMTLEWKTQCLIAGIAVVHIVCQTALDWKYPKSRETNGNGNGAKP